MLASLKKKKKWNFSMHKFVDDKLEKKNNKEVKYWIKSVRLNILLGIAENRYKKNIPW